MTTMSGYTTASTSVGHYLLEISIYPIVSSLAAAEINLTEELRDLGPLWKGNAPLLLFFRSILYVFLTFLLLAVFALAVLAQMLLFAEKALWILLEILTLRNLSRTSMERGTQEMMELLHLFVLHFPVKQLQVRVHAQHSTRANYSYRTPYIERGAFTSWFLIQFEFADPSLRNEALSILEFNSKASLWPVFYTGGERIVLVFSPFGMVERLTVVKMLKLYTDEHNQLSEVPQLSARWHDVYNNSVREFILQVDRKIEAESPVAGGGINGDRCCASLLVRPGTGVIGIMVKAMTGLNLIADLDRVSQGFIHITGVTVSQMFLATIIIGSSIIHFGWPLSKDSGGIQFYGVMISLWAALQRWGFQLLLGENRVSFASVVEEYKLAVLYGVAHSKGSRNFRSERRSWSMNRFDGSNELPHVKVLELFFGTHTIITDNLRAYQPALGSSFISVGAVEETADGKNRLSFRGTDLQNCSLLPQQLAQDKIFE